MVKTFIFAAVLMAASTIEAAPPDMTPYRSTNRDRRGITGPDAYTSRAILWISDPATFVEATGMAARGAFHLLNTHHPGFAARGQQCLAYSGFAGDQRLANAQLNSHHYVANYAYGQGASTVVEWTEAIYVYTGPTVLYIANVIASKAVETSIITASWLNGGPFRRQNRNRGGGGAASCSLTAGICFYTMLALGAIRGMRRVQDPTIRKK